jgi:outer membrane receptor protein involved in Fe transport
VKYIYVDNPKEFDQGKYSADTSFYTTISYDSLGVPVDTSTHYDYYGIRTYYVAGMQEYLWNHTSNQQSLYGVWTHTLNPGTFYELRVQSSSSSYDRGTVDVEDRDGDGDMDEYLEWDTNVEGPYPKYRDRENNYWWIRGDDRGLRNQNSISQIMKLDITSQITFNHLVKAGIDLQQHNTSVENITWGSVDTTGGTVSLGRLRKDIWEEDALDFGAYVQDKIEFEGITALVGLRYDFFDPTGRDGDIKYPGNYEEPFTEMDENNIPIFLDPQSPKTHSQLSPRIGLSFPLTENDIMYFTYGHYFQRPDAYYLYRNNQFQSLTKVGNYIGNPGLLPEKTVSYEAGVEHLFRKQIKMGVTGFYKDVTNLINWHKYVGRTIQNIEMNVFTNADYSNVKGLELSLEKRFNNLFGFSMNYSYSIAKGRSSDQWGGSGSFSSAKRLSILDYDQTRTFNSTVSLMTPKTSIFGLKVLGMMPLSDWKINFITKYGSGLPYTSYGSTLVNNMRKPSTLNTDVRVSRAIKMGPLSATITMDVFNLMDERNVDYIGNSILYDQNGDPTLVRSDELTESDNKIYYQNPQAYSDPRQYRVGVSIAF